MVNTVEWHDGCPIRVEPQGLQQQVVAIQHTDVPFLGDPPVGELGFDRHRFAVTGRKDHELMCGRPEGRTPKQNCKAKGATTFLARHFKEFKFVFAE